MYSKVPYTAVAAVACAWLCAYMRLLLPDALIVPCREPEAGLAPEPEVSARFNNMPASLRDALMPFQREVRRQCSCCSCRTDAPTTLTALLFAQGRRLFQSGCNKCAMSLR